MNINLLNIFIQVKHTFTLLTIQTITSYHSSVIKENTGKTPGIF